MGGRGLGICCVTILVAATTATHALAGDGTRRITFFAHGDHSAGEAQFGDALRGSYMSMDRTPPASDAPKSAGLTNAGVGPNHRCAGSPWFPVWVGRLGGRVTGEVVFEFHVVSPAGGKVKVRLWPDMESMGCNEDYRVPAAKTVAELPTGAGKVTAVMNDVDFETATNIMIQVTPVLPGPTQGRILYDARPVATSLTFDCTPLWGDTCAPYRD